MSSTYDHCAGCGVSGDDADLRLGNMVLPSDTPADTRILPLCKGCRGGPSGAEEVASGD